ncbi:MAG: DUF2970 domain-containing protein [Pseudomonadota bacterium]
MQAGVAEGNEKKAPVPARSETHQERKTLSLRELIGSGLAAALGVQSGKNRERDFNNGKASSFIALGIVFTAIFIGSVLTIVNLVLSGR